MVKKKDNTPKPILRDNYKYQNKPNYAQLYNDMAAYYNIIVGPEIQQQIKNIGKSVDILNINKALFQSAAASLQQANAYREEDVRHILAYKRKNKLTNSDTALHFKMSRNTLSRWERLYGKSIDQESF